jgi:hypothetical protein
MSQQQQQSQITLWWASGSPFGVFSFIQQNLSICDGSKVRFYFIDLVFLSLE